MARCKRCSLKTVLSDKDTAPMVKEVMASGMKLVDEEEYSRRLRTCMECEKLAYGTTCMLCGAVVQVRCLTERGKCPFPKNPKW
ncbi:MAG: hypothetical protein Q4G33_01735 [bacterium]|nr:hypothetical protein [bacterium]